MDASIVWLILGLVGICAAGGIIVLALLRGKSPSVTVAVKDVFSLDLKVDAQDRAAVTAEVEQASRDRGLEPSRDELDLPSRIRLARVLWLDDNPDNNVYETIALQRLGLPVTKATSSAAALRYLATDSYSVVISDMHRPTDPTSTDEFVRRARELQADLKVISYTSAGGVSQAGRSGLALQGATTSPRELIRLVSEVLDQSKN